jgi:hypothetical protein
MVARSKPSTLIQACKAWPVSASGKPEANPSTVTSTSRPTRAGKAVEETLVDCMEGL